MGTYAAGETTGSGSVYGSIEMGSAYTPATDAAEPTGSKAMNFKLEGIRGFCWINCIKFNERNLIFEYSLYLKR
jgi:hypothetical protein